MTTLPFEAELRLPASPLTGLVHMVLQPHPEEFDPSDDAHDHAGALSVLALFAHAINAQMLSEPEALPASWLGQGEPVITANGALEVSVQVEHLPLAAWAHLLALLQKNHDALEPLQALLIQAVGETAQQPLQALIDAAPQHLRHDDPGFLWNTPGVDKSKNLHLDLEFTDMLDPSVMQGLQQDLNVWLQMNILGAFDLQFEEAQDLDPLGTIKSTSPYRVECFVPFYSGGISGLVALERLVCHVHRRRQSIEEASLD